MDPYELYLLDQHHRLNLPQALLEFFRRLTTILASAVKRARDLRDALAGESVPVELRQSFEDALEMRVHEGRGGSTTQSEQSLQQDKNPPGYALEAEWDHLVEIPDAEFELIEEFVRYRTEEEIRILERLRPSRRTQRMLHEFSRKAGKTFQRRGDS